MASDADQAELSPEELKIRLIEVVESVATTEEMVADTLHRLSKQEPHRAAHLRALSAQANLRAFQKRKWAKDHAPTMNDRPN